MHATEKAIDDIESRGTCVWPILGGLRFFFATWVLFAHTYNFGLHSRAMPVFSQSGLIAVVCFFAISGFSIHHSIIVKPLGYYRRRFWRIFPTHLVAVSLAASGYFVLDHIYDGHGREYALPSIYQWLQYYLLIQVFFYPLYIDVLFPMWSLSIEAIYYIAAPLIEKMTNGLLITFIFLSGVLFVVWYYAGLANIASAPHGLQLLSFAWAWLAGWIAYSLPRNWIVSGLLVVVGFLFIATQPAPFWLVNKVSVVSTYAAWVGTVIFLFFPPRFLISARLAQLLNFLGNISFPLYLIHYPVLFALTSSVLKTHPEWNYGFVHVIASLTAAIIVYWYIDRPLRRFGDNSRRRKAFGVLASAPIETLHGFTRPERPPLSGA